MASNQFENKALGLIITFSHTDLCNENECVCDDYYNFRHYRTRMNAPINLLYYTPLLYNINTVIIPTFVPTVVPYVTIYMPF